MTLRRKFILALVGMVVFMAIVFTTIALASTQALLGHAESYVQQAYGEHLEQLLSVYYEGHNSWTGIGDYITKGMEPNQPFGRPPGDRFYVFDQNNKVIVAPAGRELGEALSELPQASRILQQWQAITVKGQVVGHYWLNMIPGMRPGMADGRVARTIGASIITAMIIGLIVTSLIALFLGLLLTRHFTRPLNRLLEAVRRVGQGDLTSRVDVDGNGDIALLARDFNRMTEQLARNEEVRRNMVADIAHELRTPLAVILGKLESIQEGVISSTPQNILPIQDETLRLIRLVRDLQQLSLAEAGKLPMNLTSVNLKQIVEKITEQFEIEFEERRLKVQISGTEVPEVTGDRDRLTQVFINLIGNALLHTPPEGTLKITLNEVETAAEQVPGNEAENQRRLRDVFRRKEGGEEIETEKWLQVTVEDSGEGIPPEDLEHIFDRFYRVDKSRERENGGTGLGLAIAKEFIQAHGGTIQVESTLGAGSTFRILLPVKPRPALN